MHKNAWTRLRRLSSGLLLPILIIVATACERTSNPFDQPTGAQPVEPVVPAPQLEVQPEAAAPAADIAWQQGMALLGESFRQVEQLQPQVQHLLDAPSAETLALAHQQWQETVQAYERFYVFTRLGLVQPRVYAALLDQHQSVGAWPVQPGFLDRYGEYAHSGIVFDLDLPITEQRLRGQHGLTDAADVALGFYALQFILFGERDGRDIADLQPISGLAEQQRAEGYVHEKELPNNRRRQLAQLQISLIRSDLMQMGTSWQAARPAFETMLPAQWVQTMLRAAQAMATEQMMALTEHSHYAQQPDDEIVWMGKQLARRFTAQLQGWQSVLELMPNRTAEPLVAPTAHAVSQLQQWSDTADSETLLRQTHQALRTLAGSLQTITDPRQKTFTVPAESDKTAP